MHRDSFFHLTHPPLKSVLKGIFLLLVVAVIAYPSLRFFASQGSENAQLPVEEIRLFSAIYTRIKELYVDEVSDKVLMRNAIVGMFQGLDPYSVYLKRSPYEDLKVSTSGKFSGLGIEIRMKDNMIEVVRPIEDTPAQKMGIKPGDLIFKIDDMDVKGMTLKEAVDLMRGELNTKVRLRVLREGEEAPLSFNIVRAEILVRSVKHVLLEPDYGYARITRFQQETAELLQEAIRDMRKQNQSALKGLILDLRSNPGGILKSAVDVADIFLENDELVVYTQGRTSDSAVKYRASQPDFSNGVPLVVLINKGSASASEIVAGVLQDIHRAMIMGRTSFGKGSVQTVHPMSNGDALKLTTARYYTPRGNTIHGTGIVPDKELDPFELTKEQLEERGRLPPQDLKGFLAYDRQVESALQELKKEEK